jgi:hypothetical protein
MATENKEELVKKLSFLEAENEKLKNALANSEATRKEFLDIKRTNQEIMNNETTVRKEYQKISDQLVEKNELLKNKEKEVEYLKVSLNKLANLFDEYILSYQDQIKLFGALVRNGQTIETHLNKKIEEFNKGDKKL